MAEHPIVNGSFVPGSEDMEFVVGQQLVAELVGKGAAVVHQHFDSDKDMVV